MPPVQANAVPLVGFVSPKVFEILREAPELVVRVIDVAPMAPTPFKVIVDPLVVLVISEVLVTLRVLPLRSIVPFCTVASFIVLPSKTAEPLAVIFAEVIVPSIVVFSFVIALPLKLRLFPSGTTI